MPNRAFSTFTDQVAERLRQGMAEGRWRGTLPGRKRLAGELGCSPWTVEEAMQRLAKEGLLVSPGAGRRRQIKLTKNLTPPSLRVGIFLYERIDEKAGLHRRPSAQTSRSRPRHQRFHRKRCSILK